MNDVSSCRESSCEFVHRSRETDCQLKPVSASIESRTDSAPSMLPSHSVTDMHHVSASQSVPGVGGITGAGQQVQHSRDIVNVGANRSDMSDDVSCRNVTATGTVVSCQLQTLSDVIASAVQPPVSRINDAVTQQTTATVDATTKQPSCTLSADMVSNVVASSSSKCSHDEDVGSAYLPAESNFVYHEETALDDMMMDSISSINPAPSEVEAGVVGSASELTASNTLCTDQVPCTSLSSETVTDTTETLSMSDGRSLPVSAALGPAAEVYMDESVDMSGTSFTMQSAAQSMIVTVNEDSAMSVTEGDQLCQLSAAVDDVDDKTMSCAVADDASNDESHSTMDDIHLVSKLICVSFLFTCPV